ncbi:MAG: hypothetical protein CSA66_05895 [Proteobacteria bacterium]|nr:MAG: hypothetical protein CSA66_05895 [Pseudomonadota bacterium]
MTKTRACGARSALAAVILAAAALGACSRDDSDGEDAVDTSTVVDTATPTGDTALEHTGTRCCPLGNCPVGDACVQGACLPAMSAGTCYLDGHCLDGQVCEGETRCECGQRDCEPTVGLCRYPDGCCNGASDCAGDQVCHQGVCREVAAGGCWHSSQCQAGESCEGLVSCPCGDDSCVAVPGVCGLAGVCCLVDAECGEGAVCRGGSCVDAPTGETCYLDSACDPGETCQGEYLCACGSAGCAVPTTPGRCDAPGGPCCEDNGACADGELCVDGRACLAAPTDNQCWVDGHCGVGRVCEGAQICDCDAEEGCASTPGECRTPVLGCGDASECPAGMRCVIPDAFHCPGAPDPTRGICVEAVDEGCWSGDDCASFMRCGGEVVCVEAQGCEAPNSPGVCRDKVLMRDCCSSHVDCEDGTECRNGNSSLTCPPDVSAVCLPSPQYGETCWNFEDCPDGFVCNRSWICHCNGQCFWNRQGACEAPRYCQADVDCGTDEVCAKDPECIASPCTTQQTCSPGGQCQPRIAGRCWNHNECAAGEYCQDLRICPPDQDCVAPDAPGLCAPRAAAGQCCTSHRGCEPGLRCVSVASMTGCFLDITAVCVPAIVTGNDCFAHEDCGPGQACSGARVCPCGVDGCTSPPQAGACVVAD